jgi:hypothetical protein
MQCVQVGKTLPALAKLFANAFPLCDTTRHQADKKG